MYKSFMYRPRAAAHYSFLCSRRIGLAFVASMALTLVACGGGGNESSPPPTSAVPPADPLVPATPVASYTVSGTVSGLLGTGLVLQNNAGEDLPIASNGVFSFATALVTGANYAVTVKSQSNILSRVCTVSNGSGTIANAAVTDVVVNCAAPAARFAYVANYNDNNVSAYTIDTTTGALSPMTGTPVPTGGQPGDITVEPTGRFAYVANRWSSNVSAYTIDATTGALSPMTGKPVPTETTPESITVDPTGRFAYVGNAHSDTVSAYTIDATTGALSPMNGLPVATGSSPYAVAVDPTGRFAYVANYGNNNVSAYSIDATTGALSQMTGTPVATRRGPYRLVLSR